MPVEQYLPDMDNRKAGNNKNILIKTHLHQGFSPVSFSDLKKGKNTFCWCR